MKSIMPIVTTSSRGQIVIPKEIRKQLQIVPGKKLSIKLENDHVRLTPLPDDRVPFSNFMWKLRKLLTFKSKIQRRKT